MVRRAINNQLWVADRSGTIPGWTRAKALIQEVGSRRFAIWRSVFAEDDFVVRIAIGDGIVRQGFGLVRAGDLKLGGFVDFVRQTLARTARSAR
jgi:hypothetical protein